MKIKFFTLLCLFSWSAYAHAQERNPEAFDEFFGDYEVVARECLRNGQVEDCPEYTKVVIGLREDTDLRQIKVMYGEGSSIGHPIYEANDSNDFASDVAVIETLEDGSARWMRELRLSDGRYRFQTRKVSYNKEKDEYVYLSKAREKGLFGSEVRVNRRYVLKLIK